jgi:hypothetical protein
MIEAALERFRAWPGALGINQAMSAFPQVDTFVAGGAVRDAPGARNSMPKDFDLFIGGAGAPLFVASLAKFGTVTYGPFGSPRWSPFGAEPYADVILIDRFNNGVEACTDIDGVLRQFDFTANAVAVNLRTYAFHDPCGGVADYRNGIMRAVRLDYPDEPIAEGSPLTRMTVLWMRLMHYSARLGLTPDATTRAWLFANAWRARHRDAFAEALFEPELSMQNLATA